ncbi:MAG: tetratricopeptide repeat protein [Anaerolineales bacterium]|jgi:tetratricopeptide (TPR) repeat protein|nr:tetratricopeptide repeat protein [Anaerolineales bacterium]
MKLLGWSWSLGRFGGVDIRFHFSTLFSLPIAWLLFHPVDLRGIVEAALWVAGVCLFILLHELGHAFAAQAVGVPVRSVVVWLLGGLTNMSYRPENPLRRLFIYSAGPLMNMLLAFLCVLAYAVVLLLHPAAQNIGVYLWLQTLDALFFSLAVVNLILVVFNLLPVYPLDGGNILHALTDWLFGRTNADRITLIVGVPILALLFGFALFTEDYILLVFCIPIAFSISTLNRAFFKTASLGLARLFNRAAYHFLSGDYERAAQMYTRDIDRSPRNVNLYVARAACRLAIGQTERAIADVERALKLNQSHMFAVEMRGELHLLRKEYEAALDRFAQAQALNPGWSVPYFDRASLLLESGEYQPALENFNKAVSLQSRMPFFYLVRSLAHFRLGDLEAAHADQDTAVGISPDDSLVMVDVNQALYEENLDWARDFYGRILERNPRHPLALQGLAEACLANQDFTSAEGLFTRAIEANPREARVYLGRGMARLELNEAEKAKADFERVSTTANKLHLKQQADDFLRKIPPL